MANTDTAPLVDPEAYSRASDRVVVLTAQEFDSPVLCYLLERLGWADADRVVIDDLVRDERIARRLPANKAIWEHYAVYRAVEGYAKVLITAFRGLGYFLLQTDPTRVQILPYLTMLQNKLLGSVLNEVELVGIELEEYILTQHKELVLTFDDGILHVLDHKLSTAHEAQSFAAEDNPSQILMGCHFLFFPHPLMKKPICDPERGTRLTPETYLAWFRDGTPPEALKLVSPDVPLVLVDEGYDVLGLAQKLRADGVIARSILAIDERKPVVRDPTFEIPGILSKMYLNTLLLACKQDRYIGYGPIDKYVSSYHSEVEPASVKLSVIIVYHNRLDLFKQMLDAFKNQTCMDFELIVIDNGSDRDIVIQDMLGVNMKILRNMNSYPGLARNLGANMAQGELITFFDDDNLPKPEFVAEILAVGERDIFDVTICFRDLFVTEQSEIKSHGFLLCAPHLQFSTYFRNYIGDNVFVIKRSVFHRLKYTDFFGVGREDIEFLQYARDSGLRVGVIPKDLYFYRLSNADKIGNKHITHRTREQTNLDFGSYRKYFRSSQSYADRKFRQIIDQQLAIKYSKIIYSRNIKVIWNRLKAKAARSKTIRSIYYRLFK